MEKGVGWADPAVYATMTDLVFALSETMDLASPALRQHQLRTAYACWRMGLAAGLGPERLKRLFTAAALHDIGAMAPEEKLRLHEYESTNMEPHCAWGEYLFSRVPRIKGAAAIVRHHHAPWPELEGAIDVPDLLGHARDQLEDVLQRAHPAQHLVRAQEVVERELARCALLQALNLGIKPFFTDKAKAAVPFKFFDRAELVGCLHDRARRIGSDNLASSLQLESIFQFADLDFATDTFGALTPLKLDAVESVFVDNVLRNAKAGVFDVHLHKHFAETLMIKLVDGCC